MSDYSNPNIRTEFLLNFRGGLKNVIKKAEEDIIEIEEELKRRGSGIEKL